MKAGRSILILLAALAASAPTATPEDEPSPRKRPLEPAHLLESIRAKHKLPALGGAVVKGKDVKVLVATGVRAAGSPEKVTTKDLWHIGSCTKAMTATLIARLVDKGKLSWQTTLQEAFPDLAKVMHPAWKPVTLELLLGNRAGAPETLAGGSLWGRLWKHKGTPTEARRTLLEGVVKKPPVSTPGTKYAYSNAGFAIAGHVAETVMKKSWEDLMRAELFEPLGMSSAGFGAPGSAQTVDQPRGHRVVSGKPVAVPPGPGADNPVAIGPAGIVHLSLEDWARFVSLHLASAKDEGEELLVRRKTLRKTHVPLKGQTYALGWVTATLPGLRGTLLLHDGSNTMWYCGALLAPSENFAVLVTCNHGGKTAEAACREAGFALATWYRKEGK